MDATAPYSKIVGAAGTAVITVRPPGRQIWTVTQVSNEMENAPSGAVCNLRKNGNLVTPLVATGDAATGDPPVILLPSDVMTVEWASCTQGLVGRAIIFYSYEIS